MVKCLEFRVTHARHIYDVPRNKAERKGKRRKQIKRVNVTEIPKGNCQ